MLNLVPKKNVIVTNLSGGMKRKVNLGIALIGGSKVRFILVALLATGGFKQDLYFIILVHGLLYRLRYIVIPYYWLRHWRVIQYFKHTCYKVRNSCSI